MVIVRMPQQPRADQVHHQAQHRDRDGFGVVDGHGRPQPLQRADHHERGDAEQQQRAREAAEHLDLPGAEGKARVAGVAPRGGVGKGAQADGQRVRAHVPAVGQKRHGVEPPAGADLDHHHGGGDPHHEAGAAFGGGIAGAEMVVVLPGAQVVGVHGFLFRRRTGPGRRRGPRAAPRPGGGRPRAWRCARAACVAGSPAG
ncbi:hypothetical protein D3C87_446780 [compost metagenome]